MFGMLQKKHVTISTHGGSQVSRQHNRRNPKVTDKEPHIKKDGYHETWVDMNHREAYDYIFGDALKSYNGKQKRNDRKIKSYYDEIKADKKKKPVYEMIVGVYNKELDDITKRAILEQFYNEWGDRNPQMTIIGAYLHGDEEGQLHLQIDYVPWAEGCYKKGLERQQSLTKCLEQQGITQEPYMEEVYNPEKKENEKRLVTKQIMWERAENQALESICNAYNLEVDHPQRGIKVKHLGTRAYKEKKELEETQKKIEENKSILQEQQAEIDANKRKLITGEQMLSAKDKIEQNEKQQKYKQGTAAYEMFSMLKN